MFKWIKSEEERFVAWKSKAETEAKAYVIKEFKEGLAKGEKALIDVGLDLDVDALAALTALKVKLDTEEAALIKAVAP